MKRFKMAAVAACIFTFSSAAFAGTVQLQNNTQSYMTGHAGISPCSSTAGQTGIIAPKQNFEVPHSVLGLFCLFGCDVSIYASKSCSGNKIAIIHLNKDHSIGKVTNQDSHYNIHSSGTTVIADSTSRLRSLFNFLFG